MKYMCKKNLLAIILVISILLVAVSCSDVTNTSTSETSKISETESEVDDGFEDGPLVKYREPVVVEYSAVNFPGSSYAEGEDENDNLHTRLQKDELNIEYKNFWYVDASRVEEKINLAIASNNLPDVMNVNAVQLRSLIRNEQVEDLTDVYEKYVSDLTRPLLEFQNKVAFIPATEKGRLYAYPLPQGGGIGEQVPITFVRQDWLDKLKLEAPTNLDQLFEVSRAFVENDPDGNGKNDTYAISLSKEPGQMTLNAISYANNAYPHQWIKDESGNLVYGSVQPEMKDALTYMNKLFEIGAFDPEFATKDMSKVTEMIVAGKIGIYFGTQAGAISPFMQVKTADPDFDLSIRSTPLRSDGTVSVGTTAFVTQWCVVKKGFKNPEAPLKSLNLDIEFQYNEENPLWQWWVDIGLDKKYEGRLHNVYMIPAPIADPRGWLEAAQKIRHWRDTGDESDLGVGGTIVVNQWIKPGGAFAWAIEKTFYEAWKIIEDYGDLQFSAYVGAPTATTISKGSSLDKLEQEKFINIIMGLVPIDDFDTFVDQWHNLGGDEITKEVNDESKRLGK